MTCLAVKEQNSSTQAVVRVGVHAFRLTFFDRFISVMACALEMSWHV